MPRPDRCWLPRGRFSFLSMRRNASSRCRQMCASCSMPVRWPRRSITLIATLACATPRGTIGGAPNAPDVDTYARLLRMADMRDLDTALVQQALTSHWRDLRVEAVRAAGQVHGAVMAPELLRLLGDR